MTLFVDCSISEYSLCEIGDSEVDNLFKNDQKNYIKHFSKASFQAAIFKNLPEIGSGLILFRNHGEGPKTLIHIRCTNQDVDNKSIIAEVNFDYGSFLFETTRSKAKRLLETLGASFDSKETEIKSISSGKIGAILNKMDQDLNLNKIKIGIAYLDRFDTSEQQMLANTIEDSRESIQFTHFVESIGNVIDLKGWKHFSGGLDVSDECLTGKRAVYKTIEKSRTELIAHVAPWLPVPDEFDDNNLVRKRHFGNDLIVIIFSESLYAFEMQTLLSRQIQVVIFVRYINRLQKYQVHVYSKIRPLFVESNPFHLETSEDFENFTNFIVSLERQCYSRRPFIDKLLNMRRYHLQNILNNHL